MKTSTIVTYIKKSVLLALILVISQPIHAELPTSRQATILDMASSAEIRMEVTGIFKSKKNRSSKKRFEVKKYGIERAQLDAKRAAIYYLLYNGTDPILSKSKEINAFKEIESKFFEEENINQFIAYIEDLPKKKILMDNKRAIKIITEIKVNKEQLLKALANEKIIESRESLLDKLGNPLIMVLPRTEKNILDTLKKDKKAAHGAGVIQSVLTAKDYEVVIPDQQNVINSLIDAQLSVENRPVDTAYKLALSIREPKLGLRFHSRETIESKTLSTTFE